MSKWIIVLTVGCFLITTAGCSKGAEQQSSSNGQAQMEEDRADEVFSLAFPIGLRIKTVTLMR